MTVGELLKQYLCEPLTQKEVAMSWNERAPSGARRKPDTIESHLSRCLGGQRPSTQRQGVRFFFGDRARAALLLEILKVPAVDRDPIYAAADELLKMDKDRPPRLIIDVTARSGRVDGKRLFEALRVAFVEPRVLAPALLLLTEEQYDDLPRSFDHHQDWLSVEIVAEVEGAPRLAELGSASALVASFKRYDPPARWLAIDLDQKTGTLLVEPADGLVRFARDGALPLPVVAHDLAELMPGVAIPPFDPDSIGPIQQRRAMADLGSEDRAEQVAAAPAKRLAMARALGVVATATPRDRVEAELCDAASGLGLVNIPPMPAAKFTELLARAQRRAQPPTVVRVEDQIKVINPEPAQPGLEHARVAVHRIEAPEPVLVRLRATVEGWTQGDFEADPFLHRLLRRLDPNRQETLAFLHARALLLRQPLTPMRRSVVEDWRPVLARLLDREVPLARLRLPKGYQGSSEYWTVAPSDGIETALQGRSEIDSRVLSYPRPAIASGIPITRGEVAVLASENDGHSRTRDASNIASFDVAGESLITAGEKWLDAFDAWNERRRVPGPCFTEFATKLSGSFPWDEADRQLGIIWLALREAVRSAPAVELEGGRVLLSIGDGIAAQLEVTETTEILEGCGLVDVEAYSAAYNHPTVWVLSLGVASGVSDIKLEIPRRIILLGEKIRAEIQFIGAPLLSRTSARSPVVAAELASQAKKRAEEEARARDYDDDD